MSSKSLNCTGPLASAVRFGTKTGAGNGYGGGLRDAGDTGDSGLL